MIRNEETYKQAVEFRKRGFTYSEIAKICDVSKSTVSAWLSKKAFSKRIKKDNEQRAVRDNKKRMALINKTRGAERNTRYAEAIRSAETEYKHYKQDPVFAAGLTAYMSSGDLKHASQVRLTSNRSIVHRIFIRFLLEYVGVSKNDIQFWLLMNGSKNVEKNMKWWSKETGLSVAQFGKTQCLSGRSSTLHKGTGNTIIGSTVLKKKIIRWIELSEKELKKS